MKVVKTPWRLRYQSLKKNTEGEAQIVAAVDTFHCFITPFHFSSLLSHNFAPLCRWQDQQAHK